MLQKFVDCLPEGCIQPMYRSYPHIRQKSKSNKTNNNNTNFNNIYLILSGGKETSLWMGYDGFHDNVRKDLNYG